MSNFKNVLNLILKKIKTSETAAPPIPSTLILLGGEKRPGMNARVITSRIISRKSEAGAPIGPLPDGSDSVDEKMIRIMVEEIIKSLISEAKITVVVPPGTPITATGVNGGGPVLVQGTTTSLTKGYAIIQ